MPTSLILAIGFGTLGPDWGDGSVSLPALAQSDPPNNCWTHTYTQPGPHKISILVFEQDILEDNICWSEYLCTTIDNDCPIDTSDCFSVVDIQVKGITCDTTDCYEDPFCQSWLIDEIADLSCFGIPTAKVDKANYNGQTVFVIESIYLDIVETKIYQCDGSLLQSCYTPIPNPTI